MRDAVGVLPRRLDPGLLEGPLRPSRRRLAKPAGRWARESLELRGEPLRDLVLDVDVRVELGDEEAGDRVADLLVLEQLAARLSRAPGA